MSTAPHKDTIKEAVLAKALEGDETAIEALRVSYWAVYCEHFPNRKTPVPNSPEQIGASITTDMKREKVWTDDKEEKPNMEVHFGTPPADLLDSMGPVPADLGFEVIKERKDTK